MKTWGTGDEIVNNPLSPNLNSIEAYDGNDGINNYSLARAIRNLTDNDTELYGYLNSMRGEENATPNLMFQNSFTLTGSDFISATVASTTANVLVNFSGALPANGDYFEFDSKDGKHYKFTFDTSTTVISSSGTTTILTNIPVQGLTVKAEFINAARTSVNYVNFLNTVVSTNILTIYDKITGTQTPALNIYSPSSAMTSGGSNAGTANTKTYLRVNTGLGYVNGALYAYGTNINVATRQLEKAFRVNKFIGESVVITNPSGKWAVTLTKKFNNSPVVKTYNNGGSNHNDSISLLNEITADSQYGQFTLGYFNSDFFKFKLEKLIDTTSFSGNYYYGVDSTGNIVVQSSAPTVTFYSIIYPGNSVTDVRQFFQGRNVFTSNTLTLNASVNGATSTTGTISSVTPTFATPSTYVKLNFFDAAQSATTNGIPAIYWDGTQFVINKSLKVSGNFIADNPDVSGLTQIINDNATIFGVLTSSQDINITGLGASIIYGNTAVDGIKDKIVGLAAAVGSVGAVTGLFTWKDATTAGPFVCCVASDGTYYLADKRYSNRAEVSGYYASGTLTINSSTNARSGLANRGFVAYSPNNLTIGSAVFLGNSGAIIQNDVLIAAGEFRVYLGIATKTNEIYFDPQEPTVNSTTSTSTSSLDGIGMIQAYSGFKTKVVITGGSPTANALAVARVNNSGLIIGIDVMYSGSGFTSVPTVKIYGPAGSSGATASVILSGGTTGYVTQINVTAGGTGYTNVATPWLYCDGSAVSRGIYSSLFAVLGTTYGPGDGSTTFNLPDFRGTTLRASDDGADFAFDKYRFLPWTKASFGSANIATGTTITTAINHNLVANDMVMFVPKNRNSVSNFSGVYYVLTTPSTTQLTVATSRGGSAVTTLSITTGNYYTVKMDFTSISTTSASSTGGVFTATGHGLISGDYVVAQGTIPTGLTLGNTYRVTVIDDNTFSLIDDIFGAAITSTSAVSGTVFYKALRTQGSMQTDTFQGNKRTISAGQGSHTHTFSFTGGTGSTTSGTASGTTATESNGHTHTISAGQGSHSHTKIIATGTYLDGFSSADNTANANGARVDRSAVSGTAYWGTNAATLPAMTADGAPSATHTHTFSATNVSVTLSNIAGSGTTAAQTLPLLTADAIITDGTNGDARYGSETRMANSQVHYVVRYLPYSLSTINQTINNIGSSGGSISTQTVGTNAVLISKIVYASASGVQHADYSAETTTMAIGVSTYGASSGASVGIQSSGLLLGFSTGLTPNTPIFLGANGAFITDPNSIPVGNYRVMIGYAVNTTDIMINISEPSQVISNNSYKVGLGRISQWAGVGGAVGTLPTNFLPLDGRAISRTFYADLFALWGTTYGVGDGTSTFNIPDWGSLNVKDNNGTVTGFWIAQVFPDSLIVSGNSVATATSYITNGDFESAVSFWNLYNDGAVATPVDGTGGSTTSIAVTRNTTTPLFGTGDLLLTKGAAISQQGYGLSYDFNLDPGILGQAMSLSFYYKTIDVSGTAYADNDYSVFLYDKTNSSFIPLSISGLPRSTNASKFYASWFPSNSTSYRLVIHQTSTSTGNYNLELDKADVSPQIVPNAAAVGGWNTYTPSIVDSGGTSVLSASPNVNVGYWRRVGSNMEVRFSYYHQTTVGTLGAAGNYRIKIPSGYTIDSSVSSGSGNSQVAVGVASGDLGGGTLTNFTLGLEPSFNGVRASNLATGNQFASGGNFQMNTAYLSINGSFTVPIAQWTTNINLATDFTEYAYNTDATTTAGNVASTGSVSGRDGANIIAINSGTVSSSTKKILNWSKAVQNTDLIIVEVLLSSTSSWLPVGSGPSQNITSLTSVNTAVYGIGYEPINSTSGYIVFGNGGRSFAAGGGYGGTGVAWTDISAYKWRVRKVSNGNMAEQPPVVRAEYYSSDVASTTTPINYSTKVEDTHNAVTTGTGVWKFTAPIAGVYHVSAGYLNGSATASNISLYKNGSNYRSIAYASVASGLAYGSKTIRLLVGDYINIVPVNTNGNAASTSAAIEIARIGS